MLINTNLKIEVRKYEEGDKEQWEALIERSANGTFLHRRSFMEYHGDRFQDASVMVWEGDIQSFVQFKGQSEKDLN